jgi:acetoin utilization protein AcuB
MSVSVDCAEALAWQALCFDSSRVQAMNMNIRKYMSHEPYTIGQDQPLSVAHEVMRQHNVRHLPVLAGGKLVGVLSQRDLHLIETLREVDPATTTVDEAMTGDVYITGPDAPLDEVASHMAEHKYGSTVVVDRGKVIGLFTTVDALTALSALAKNAKAPKR